MGPHLCFLLPLLAFNVSAFLLVLLLFFFICLTKLLNIEVFII